MIAPLSTTNSDLRRRSLFVFAFVLGLLLMDHAGAWMMGNAYQRIYTGPGRYNYIKSRPFDILIMGSSTSTAYYADQLSTRTGWSAINVGIDGSALIYARCLLDLVIYNNVKPRMVILNIDLFELSRKAWSGNYYSMIEKLAPLYGETPLINASLEKGKFSEWLKYRSRLYCYNDLLLSIPAQLFSGNDRYQRGHAPNKVMALPLDNQTIKDRYPSEIDLDPRKLSLYEDFMLTCKANDILPVFIEGPIYYQNMRLTRRDIAFEDQISTLTGRHGVPFIKITQETDARFRSNELFKDVLHLNNRGATLFTDLVADHILCLIANDMQ